MDILNILNCVVQTIEKNVCDDISVSELAKSALMSEYELSNLFYSLTGVTIKEYIRRRRLTSAAFELQQSNNSIIDIAIKYGYGSADSFRRAFICQHNCTPSAVRNEHSAINIYPPLSFQIKVEGVNKMNFKIIDAEEMIVFGISRPCDSSDTERYEFAREMWDENCDNLPKQICSGYDGEWYGVWNKNSYSIARAKADCENNNLSMITIPKGRYAVFTTEKGGYAGDVLPKLHNDIFNLWLANSDYEIAFDLEIEVYHLDTNRETRRKNRFYEIRVPIKDKH